MKLRYERYTIRSYPSLCFLVLPHDNEWRIVLQGNWLSLNYLGLLLGRDFSLLCSDWFRGSPSPLCSE